MKGDVRKMDMFKTGQFGAVFVGEVLEHLDAKGMQDAVDELFRVAEEVFVSHLPDHTLTAWTFPGIKSVIHAAPPKTPYSIEFTEIATGKRQVVKPHTTFVGLEGLGAFETDTKTAIYLRTGGTILAFAGLILFLILTREYG